MNNAKWMCAGSVAVAVASGISLTSVPETLAQDSPRQFAMFQGIIDFLRGDVEDRGRGSNGGSRGNGPFCIINPGDGETLWTQQPLFIVENKVAEIGLQSDGETEATWRVPIPERESDYVQVLYDGEPLQPGEQYDWLFYQSLFGQPPQAVFKTSFQVMAAGEQRDRLATELDQLQAELEAAGASEEEIAEARANYFFENDLPSDGFQEFFSVESPSEELVAAREAAIEDICSQKWPL